MMFGNPMRGYAPEDEDPNQAAYNALIEQPDALPTLHPVAAQAPQQQQPYLFNPAPVYPPQPAPVAAPAAAPAPQQGGGIQPAPPVPGATPAAFAPAPAPRTFSPQAAPDATRAGRAATGDVNLEVPKTAAELVERSLQEVERKRQLLAQRGEPQPSEDMVWAEKYRSSPYVSARTREKAEGVYQLEAKKYAEERAAFRQEQNDLYKEYKTLRDPMALVEAQKKLGEADKQSDSQRRMGVLSKDMRDSEEIIGDGGELTNTAYAAAWATLPTWARGHAVSNKYISQRNAGEAIVGRGVFALSGAASPPEEVKREITLMLPQPGDSPQILLEKKEARMRLTSSIAAAAGGSDEDKARAFALIKDANRVRDMRRAQQEGGGGGAPAAGATGGAQAAPSGGETYVNPQTGQRIRRGANGGWETIQ